MSSKKDREEGQKGFDIDFEAFETRLEDEIDKLFIPVGDPSAESGDILGFELDKGKFLDELSEVKPNSGAVEAGSDLRQPKPPLEEFSLGELDKGAPDRDQSQFLDLLDSEVDKLFVPVEETVISGASDSVAEGGEGLLGEELGGAGPLSTSDDLLADLPMPELSSQEGRRSEAFERSKMEEQTDFDLQLDSEIDRLFVPVEESPFLMRMEEEVLSKEPVFPAEPRPVSPGPQVEAGLTAGAAQARQGMQAGRKEPAKAPVEKVPTAKDAKPVDRGPADQRELTTLIESLTIAFLSLDWEFSPENISRMNHVLKKLEPYSSRIPEAHSLSKMLNAVLHFLKTKTRSTSPQMIDFLHRAHELMKSMLLSQSPPGLLEKNQLKKLISDFKSMGGKAASRKGAERRTAGGEVASEEKPSVSIQGEGPLLGLASKAYVPGDGHPFAELERWIEWFSTEFKAAIDGIEAEKRRLRNVQDATRKNSVLAPLTSRLGSITSFLERHVFVLRKQEEELVKQLAFVQDAAKMTEEKQSAPAEVFVAAVPDVSEAEPEETKAAEQVVRDEVVEAAAVPPEAEKEEEIRQELEQEPEEEIREVIREAIKEEEVCLFEFAGKRFAIPADNVVKIGRLSGFKSAKIAGRGYATLSDLKPFLRKLKTGVLGKWQALPDEVLKSYEFALVSSKVLHPSVSEESVATNGVILLSDGGRHRLIFSDFSGISLQTVTMTVQSEDRYAVGVVDPESTNPIRVLNIDRIFA